jgi:hypothetical protein
VYCILVASSHGFSETKQGLETLNNNVCKIELNLSTLPIVEHLKYKYFALCLGELRSRKGADGATCARHA